MNRNTICVFLCLIAVVGVLATDVDPASRSADTPLSRQKRGFLDDIFNGLTNTFSKTVDQVLGLEDGDFKKVVDGVKNIGVAAAKKILGFFNSFASENQDLDETSAKKMHALMEALRDDIQEREGTPDQSGATMLTTSCVATVVVALTAAYTYYTN